MSQPSWKLLYSLGTERVFTDETGVYPEEMEVAQEGESDDGSVEFYVYRFPLDRLQIIKSHLVSASYKADWPHPVHSYVEWFADSLKYVAASAGTSERELRTALCSEDVKHRAWAYNCIGGHHGFDNFDGYPLVLSENQLNERWL